ncbi:MAG: DNA/RNA nuclease SfsA, partial [Clostridia bacterium]
RSYIEVKGVTLEEDGMALFPDAPTLRGTRHVHEMIRAVREGYTGYLIFVVQMKGVRCFSPNERTDPAFTQALRAASRQNVHVLCYDCHVTPDSLRLSEPVPVIL